MKNLVACLLIVGAFVSCSKTEPAKEVPEQLNDSSKNGAETSANSIIVYTTKADASKKMFREANIGFNSNTTTNPVITIDASQKFQTIDGCGLALTGSAAYMLKQLSQSARTTLLKELFEVGNTMSLSIIRITIGASDFSTTPYTYDDMPSGQTDGGLASFSLNRHDDLNYVIPVLEEILAINPNIKIMAAPWSPPAWMKRSGSLNAIDESDTYNNSLMDGYRTVWASYLVKYLQALKNNSPSIPVWAITVQNEPRTLSVNYPTCYMTASNQKFIIKDLRTKMDNAGFSSTKIFCGENNWAGYSYITDFYDDADARNAVAGAAFHGYTDENSGGSSDVMTPIHNSYPSKELHLTEYSGNRNNGFAGELESFMVKRLIYPFRNWAQSVSFWNLALDENRNPNIKIGGTNSRPVLTINSSTKDITRNVDYYVLAHASKFLRSGAQRISSSLITENNIHNVAFQNPDGWKTLVVYNTASVARTIDVKIGTNKFTYTVPNNTAVTFNWL